MARKKLIEYLNNPLLLQEISVEEMKAWAAEVPYAGLVQRLLVQKLVMEDAGKKDLDRATAFMILSHANPHHALKSVADFKKMILAEDDVDKSATSVNVDQLKAAHSVSDDQVVTEDPAVEKAPPPAEIKDAEGKPELSDQKQYIDLDQTEESDHPEPEQEIETSTDQEVISTEPTFTGWLSTLNSLQIPEDQVTDIKLDNQSLASDTLAKLLIDQGHYEKARAMYRTLMLKYPQKSSFFAAQIEKIKEL